MCLYVYTHFMHGRLYYIYYDDWCLYAVLDSCTCATSRILFSWTDMCAYDYFSFLISFCCILILSIWIFFYFSFFLNGRQGTNLMYESTLHSDNFFQWSIIILGWGKSRVGDGPPHLGWFRLKYTYIYEKGKRGKGKIDRENNEKGIRRFLFV